MPKWMKKTLVVLITVFTFGLVTPPSSLSIQDAGSNSNLKPSVINSRGDSLLAAEFAYEAEEANSNEDFVKKTMKHAVTLSFEKFGQKIGPTIEDEFREVILPKMEEVVSNLSNEYSGENLKYLAVSENPSGGIGERIFNIYDNLNNKELIRFHVRRDKLPQDGYWFNFHYHTHHDGFQSHYPLGSIYWDKNTPPRWLS